MKTILISIVLGIATYVCISLTPSTASTIDVQEALVMPGTVLASLIWPEGVESDSPYAWLVVGVLTNVLVFTFFWYVVVQVFKKVRGAVSKR